MPRRRNRWFLDGLFLIWGLGAGMNTVVLFGWRLSHLLTLVLAGVLGARVLLLRTPPRLLRDRFFVASLLLVTGGTVASGLAAEEVRIVMRGYTAIIGGTVVTIALMVMGTRVGARVLGAAHGVVVAALANAVATTWSGETSDGRRTGLMQHPNHTGLVIVLGLFLYLLLRPRGEGRWHRKVPWWAVDVVVFTVLGYGLLQTGSRSAVLGAVVGLVFVARELVRRPHHLALIMVAVLAGFAVLAPQLGGTAAIVRLGGGGSAANSDVAREELLSEAVDVVRTSPLVGAGLAYVSSAHNVPLQMWQTAGLLGLVALAIIVITMIGLLRRKVSGWSGAAAKGILALVMANWLIQNTVFSQYLWIAILTAAMTLRASGTGRSTDADADRVRAVEPRPRRGEDLRPGADVRAPAHTR